MTTRVAPGSGEASPSKTPSPPARPGELVAMAARLRVQADASSATYAIIGRADLRDIADLLSVAAVTIHHQQEGTMEASVYPDEHLAALGDPQPPSHPYPSREPEVFVTIGELQRGLDYFEGVALEARKQFARSPEESRQCGHTEEDHQGWLTLCRERYITALNELARASGVKR